MLVPPTELPQPVAECRVWTWLLLHEVWDSLFLSPHSDQGAIADKAIANMETVGCLLD